MKRLIAVLPLLPALSWAQPATPPTADRPPEGIAPKPSIACRNELQDLLYNGIQGRTALHYTITEEGSVRDITITKSSGNADLDEAALACSAGWRFRPAVKDGKPVAVSRDDAFTFTIDPSPLPPLEEPAPDCLRSYPVKAEDLAGISGVTEIRFMVVHGRVQHAVVMHSSGNAALDTAALQCIESRHYKSEMVVGRFNRPVDRWGPAASFERIDWHKALTEK